LDEYHYGAWRENAKDLFDAEDTREAEFGAGKGIEDFDEDIMPITTDGYLYLSGTPFRAIASGEFIEERYSTGRIPMNSAQSRNGRHQTTPAKRFRGWSC
jgi:hypothetical protein